MIQIHTLRITPNFLSIIAEIDEFKGAWRALGSLAPERLSALRRVATIESIGSSTRIEGSRLSDQEVQRLLSNLDIQTFSTRDEEEVAGYAQVMDAVFASWRDMDVTENHIRQLHRDLLRHSGKDQRHRGAWKTAPNSIAAFDEAGRQLGVVFETASPFDKPDPDHLAAFAFRLCLCTVLLPRKRDRAKQGGLLSGPSTDPGNDQV